MKADAAYEIMCQHLDTSGHSALFDTGLKVAAADDVLPMALLGAGVGGLGGHVVGRLRKSKNLWGDTLAGAGLGGVAGGLYGGLKPGKTILVSPGPKKGLKKPVPTEPVIPEHLKPPKPTSKSKESLVQNVKRYYRNSPGGIEGVIERAEANQFVGPGEHKWKHNDPYTEYPIQQTTRQGMADKKVSDAAGITIPTQEPPGSEILLLPPDAVGVGNVREYQQNKEHELTHSALQQSGLHRALTQAWPWQRQQIVDDYTKLMRRAGMSRNLFGVGMDYLTSASEMAPRLAQIKRFYVEAHPGEDVTTPAQARKAMKWFTDYSRSDEGKYRLGNQSIFWNRMVKDPDWSKVEPEAAQRMPGLVQNAPVMPTDMKMAAVADYAPGLPSKSDMGHADKLRVGQMLDYVIQHHKAERAGPHYDVRFGNKDTGLLSWAARKGVPEPGQKHLAVQQPLHRHGYKDFEGNIESGYGKGTVKKHDEGQILLTKVTPHSIHFSTASGRYPERFTLARPKGWDRNWLLMNTTPRAPIGYQKLHYKKIPPEQVEPALKTIQEGTTAEAKIDGASQLIQLAKGHAEALSFRTSKVTGGPIVHTERLFGGRPEIKVPPHLEGSILKGEAYASPGPGRAGTAQDVGTLLNSSIARSLQLQKERGLTLRNMLYDVQQYGRKPIDPAVTPRADRRKMLEEIAAHLPTDKFHVSEEAHGPEAATKLWNLIRSGKHPLTQEGIIIHPKVGIPSKAKLFEDVDAHITGVFPGEGKRRETVGGFTYGRTAGGPTVGRVGTGLSDAFLKEVAQDPSAYIGRVARLKAQQQFPSGALRAPSFIALHEDYPNKPGGSLRKTGSDHSRAEQAAIQRHLVDLPLHLQNGEGYSSFGVIQERQGDAILRLFAPRTKQAAVSDTRSVHDEGLDRLAEHGPPLYQQKSREVSGLRWPGDQGLQKMAEVRGVSGGHGPAAAGPDHRAEGQQRSVPQEQLRLGNQERTGEKPSGQPALNSRWSDASRSGLGGAERNSSCDYHVATGEGLLGRGRGVASLVSGTAIDKLAGFFSFADPVPVVDPNIDPVTGRPRRQRPIPPPTWADTMRDVLWGRPNAIVPEIVKEIEEQEEKTADDKWTSKIRNWFSGTKPSDVKLPTVTAPVGTPPAAPAAPATPELPPNPFAFIRPSRPATVNYPSPTGVATKQLSAPALPALPTGRAGPAMLQVRKVLGTNQPDADRLADALHGLAIRQDLTTASRAAGYPADPGAAPASAIKLLGETYPHKLPSTRFENQPSGKAQYNFGTGQTEISDPLPWKGPGREPWPALVPWLQQRAVNNVAPNRLALTRHETEHALQNIYEPPVGIRMRRGISLEQMVEEAKREARDRSNAMEIPPSLGDLPFTAQMHKLETGKPLNVPVDVAPGITHDADWMSRQAEQHGMFKGRTMTELLATPAGKAYLQRLLAAHTPPPPSNQPTGVMPWVRSWFEKQNAAHPVLADLKRAKAESDRGNYKAKHQILSKLLDEHPGAFVQDSTSGSMIGLTHPATGFKIHAPAQVVRGRAMLAPIYHGSATAGIEKLKPRYRTKAAANDKKNVSTLPDGRVLDIGKLIDKSKGRRVESIPIDDVPKPSRSEASGYSKARQAKVDMSKPVIVGTDGTLYDGRHRLFRHIDENKTHIRAVRVSDADIDDVTICDDCKAQGDKIDKNRIEMLPAKAAALIKLADLLPWVHLQPQQQRVAKKVREGQNLLVYHGLGSGKSLAGIAAAEGVGGPYTAVVPASLRPNYEGEIGKFSDQETPSEVMSYTGVGMGRQPKQDPDTIIMDEVQRLRNPNSAASQAAINLATRAKHKVLLSGTPIVNAPSDLAVPLSILTGEEMSPASFTKRFVGTKTVDPGWMGWFQGIQPAKVPTIKDEEGLERLLENHVDYQPSRTPEGVKTRDERVEVDLSPEQQDFYKLMWGKLPWMTRWKLSNDYPLTGPELTHLSSFMTGPRQAALSLYPYHSSKDPIHAFKTSAKLQSAMGSLKKTLAKDPRAKALVYSNFIDAGLTPYGAALRAEGIPFGQFHGTMTEEDRKQALSDYNAGKLRVLLLGPAAAEGISAKGTQLIQLLDPHWNEARLGQARGRGLRFDSHEGLPPELRNVRIQRFVAKMPKPGWLGRLFGATARPSADEVLEQQSRRKEELNDQFREVLRRVGSPGYQRPWHLFG
jgi:DNA polymerase Ligase (LigD)/Helicase conserved C-terminal domain/SNF2-related domain